jgi:RNA polymerase-interacting CarD/CdnL/TRCF family regulator
MFAVGDKVVYANYGVCIVKKNDEHMTMGGTERVYYVLDSTRNRGGTVYVPIDQEDHLRPVMTRDQAIETVRTADEIQEDPFKDSNSRTVEDHFRGLLHQNDMSLALCVAKTMRSRIHEQEEKRHIPSSMYTRLFDQATRQINSELAAALDMDEDEVESYLRMNTSTYFV